VVSSMPSKVYKLTFYALTEAMAEKLILAFKHDNLTIDNVPLVAVDGSFEPTFEIFTGFANLEVRAAVKNYNYANYNC